MDALARVVETECVGGTYRGYYVLIDYERLGPRLVCAGYRGVEAAGTDPGTLHDPAACRDGEQVHYDSEEDLRAAIDATYAAPGGAT